MSGDSAQQAAPTARDSPVFVIAPPGVDATPLIQALATAADLRPIRDEDPLRHVPQLHPSARGWDSARLGFQDAKRPLVHALAAAWREQLGTADARPLISPANGVLQLPFLAAGWPQARFVVLTQNPEAALAKLRAEWRASAPVRYPDLPDWEGLAWTGPLTPGWRELIGEPLDAVVRAQRDVADRVLTEDLPRLRSGQMHLLAAEAVSDPDAIAHLARWLSAPEAEAPEGPSRLRSSSTPTVPDLLGQLGSTLLATTYQTGFLVMARADGDRLNTHFRKMRSPMGVARQRDLLTVGTKEEVITFTNVAGMAPTLEPQGKHDACFVPRYTLHTGDIRVHDVAWVQGQLWAVATRFSCLVTFDGAHSFLPKWKPHFITEIAPEDRCHLNGMAVVDDRVKYVTALGTSNQARGWRATKADGGVLMDVETQEIIVSGLSMPHSPRWYRDQLWVLESGEGSLARVDLKSGTLETVAHLPGFTRGLAFAGRYAFVGLSEVREANLFGGIPLTRRLEQRECGVWIVDIETGETVGFLRFEDQVQEIYDVALLHGMRFPELLMPGDERTTHAFLLPSAH